jgi:hypothetical protein
MRRILQGRRHLNKPYIPLYRMTKLAEVIQLFESRHTESLSDRHAEAIVHMCKHYKEQGLSFYYRELEELAHTLTLVHKSLAAGKVGRIRLIS